MTATEFLEAYAARSGVTPRELLAHGRYPVACDCAEETCEGWQLAHVSDLEGHMEDPKTMEDSTPQSKWESVVEEVPGQNMTDRLRVDTGYIYRTIVLAGATTKSAGQVAVALAFVPDRATP